jgi:hypothetical protein
MKKSGEGEETTGNNHWIVNGQVGIGNEVCMKEKELTDLC